MVNSTPAISVNKDFAHQEIQKIAVLMFGSAWDEGAGPKFRLSKRVEDSGAGAVLADITALELKKWGRYVVLDRMGVKEQLLSMNIREEDSLLDSDYGNLGRSLGVDAVVVGKIKDFGVAYNNMIGKISTPIRSKVSFEIKCMEVLTNKTVWSINAKGGSVALHERALASSLVAKAIESLKKEINLR
ncbi:MAG: hypothetical protein GY941_08405 [Planctomycetes bacterium]|nr:hypothetical protein [Planctomycetota bacterium]